MYHKKHRRSFRGRGKKKGMRKIGFGRRGHAHRLSSYGSSRGGFRL
jgi:hypothetical protein